MAALDDEIDKHAVTVFTELDVFQVPTMLILHDTCQDVREMLAGVRRFGCERDAQGADPILKNTLFPVCALAPVLLFCKFD